MDNPDNPMARPLSRAEEERLFGDVKGRGHHR